MHTISEPAKEVPVLGEHDVVVVGGGPGGMMAALAAARSGADTVLVERFGFLGGMATAGLMTSFNGFRNEHPPDHLQTVRGLAQELIDRLIDADGACACTAHGHFGELNKGESPYAVSFDSEVLKLVAMEMLEEAGVKMLFHTWFSDVICDDRNVEAALVEGKSGRGALLGKIFIDAAGDGDLSVRAGARFEKAPNDDPRQMRMTLMYRVTGLPKPELDERRLWVNDITTRWGPDIGALDGSDTIELTRAEIETRKRVAEHVANLREEFPDTRLVETASVVGVRETRRIVGIETITEDDVKSGRPRENSIAVCSNPVPGYYGQRYFLEHLGFEIPYGSLVPADLDNVMLAGRCISASQPAFQSARSMVPNMAISQASGAAAAMCCAQDIHPANLDAASLIERLKADGQVTQIPPDMR
jgi:hypothetical protein